jgi:hypothetical protein
MDPCLPAVARHTDRAPSFPCDASARRFAVASPKSNASATRRAERAGAEARAMRDEAAQENDEPEAAARQIRARSDRPDGESNR